VVLSGPPLLLFIIFTTTVFIVSLIAALIIGLIAALLFTVFALLVALFVVLPTVFLTTLGATFLFLWGLGGYYIVKWFNEGETPAEVGAAIGDKINTVTGGRLSWLMGSARAAEKSDDQLQEKEALLGGSGHGLSTERFSSPGRGLSPAGSKRAAGL
jgi:Promethin